MQRSDRHLRPYVYERRFLLAQSNARTSWTEAAPRRTTLRGNLGPAYDTAAGGADRRSAKNAARPMNQSREAHLAAWPLHSPEGG
jgi:hypothetical protein